MTKLGDGPNSLVSSDEGFPTTRLKCFPLYSVLLAYNATILDYLSLDSPDAHDDQVNRSRRDNGSLLSLSLPLSLSRN